ncbi:MAG: FAD binding domain-containing protein [Acidobacteriia bacterium]|nr:FAD binding domain-containing protein [Terriglobia bacterium]
MMRLPKFEYFAPTTISTAVKLMGGAGMDGQFVAGGTDLYPNMKRRQQTPRVVIGLEGIAALKRISGDPLSAGLTIGAAVTLTELIENRKVRKYYPVVAEAARLISTPLLQNMGTIGGNLLLDTRCNYYDQNYEWRRGIHFCLKKDGDTCWVAPGSKICWAVQSSDEVPVMIALGAGVKLVSAKGERTIPVAELYTEFDGIRYHTKEHGELLTEIILPPTGHWRASYRKLRRRGSFDFPVLGVAACVWFEADDETVREARLVLGAIAPHAMRVPEAEGMLVGRPLDDASIHAAATAAHAIAKPLDNTDFLMYWRKEMVRPFVEAALKDLRHPRKS